MSGSHRLKNKRSQSRHTTSWNCPLATILRKLQIQRASTSANIEAMYNASGVNINASWGDALNAIENQVGVFISGITGQQYTPSIFTQTNEDGQPFAQVYDAQGRYVGFSGTHDITGRDAEGNKTGTNASSREAFGLGPAGELPLLPGQTRPRERDDDDDGNVSGGGASATSGGGAYRGALGGFTRGAQRMIIGEAGQEVLIPLDRMDEVFGSYLRSKMQAGGGMSMSGMQGMGSNTYIINMPEGTHFVDDPVEYIQDALLEAERRGIA